MIVVGQTKETVTLQWGIVQREKPVFSFRFFFVWRRREAELLGVGLLDVEAELC